MEYDIMSIIVILFIVLVACFILYIVIYAVIAIINLFYLLFTGKNLTIYDRIKIDDLFP